MAGTSTHKGFITQASGRALNLSLYLESNLWVSFSGLCGYLTSLALTSLWRNGKNEEGQVYFPGMLCKASVFLKLKYVTQS